MPTGWIVRPASCRPGKPIMQSQPALSEDISSVHRISGEPTVAVAFGAGGARGVAHIHVIEALDELGIRPVAISGASIGSIIGSGMAAGMTGREVRESVLSVFSKRSEVISRIWKSRPYSMGDMFSGGFRLGQFNIERTLPAFLPESLPKRFEDLEIPMKIIVTDFYAQEEAVCESGDLYNAIAASSAIPALFRPVLCNNRYMIDGGIFNPVPYDHLAGLADIIIGIDVVGRPSGTSEDCPTTVDLIYGSSQIMMQSIIAMKLKAASPHIFLRPDVSAFRVLDFFKAEEILEATTPIRDELKYSLDAIMAFAGKADP